MKTRASVCMAGRGVGMGGSSPRVNMANVQQVSGLCPRRGGTASSQSQASLSLSGIPCAPVGDKEVDQEAG